MKISLFLTGKTNSPEIKILCEDYRKRVNRYMKMEEWVIDTASAKTTDPVKLKQAEGALLLKKIQPADFVILLDDKGKSYTSLKFAQHLESVFNQSIKNLCFVVGGAYGFSEEVYQRANEKLSLSQMTFSHQVIRLIFYEQLYRAFTIIHKEPYHHE